MEGIVQAFEVAGVAIFAVGSLAAAVRVAVRWSTGQRERLFEMVRRDIGRSILLGLEVLIIADIVHTIIIDLTLESALTLSIIVLVRTFLSFSLEVELEGTFPWRLAALGRGGKVAKEPEQIGGTT
jgi:uncharacterized membrane protein